MDIDLDALAKELTEAGLECLIERGRLYADRSRRRFVVSEFGAIYLGAQERKSKEWLGTDFILTKDWEALDIIRRHIEGS